MQEKIYKVMGSAGATALTLGICVLVGGLVSGVLLIVHAGRLLKAKGNVIF